MSTVRKLNKTTKMFGFQDYWKMSDKKLILLANDKKIIDMHDFGTTTHSDFENNELTKTERRDIIDELIKHDKHRLSYIAIVMSIIALFISVAALFS